MKSTLDGTVVVAVVVACSLLLMGTTAQAQDRAELDRTQITGNRELPKVLYIVPWKKPLPGQLSGRPVHSVLDEALAPVDRAVFRRQLDFSSQLQARAATASTAKATESMPVPAAPAMTPNTTPAPNGAAP